MTAADLVAAFGQVSGGHAVLTFYNGDVLQIDTVNDLTALAAVIDLY